MLHQIQSSPSSVPLLHVICVKAYVAWDLRARCEPFIDVVKTSDRSLVLTREVFWFGYESCSTLCKP